MNDPPTRPASSDGGPASSHRPIERRITRDLLGRYDRPGPRYTSYPTALEFHEGVGLDDYTDHLRKANHAADEPLSVYMHLPFCAERCTFCGCHVIITPHKQQGTAYIDLLKQEVGQLADHLPDRRTISQLHLGGGTPTYHAAPELRDLLTTFLDSFRPTDGAELAVEVDPRVTTREHIDTLADLGFNRVSLGVQDFTPDVQQAIAREQTVDQTVQILEHARARGFGGINVDLIYGLPFQTEAAFEATVDRVIEMGADRAAVYSFAFVPWIRAHQTRFDENDLPPADVKMSLFAIARERFLQAGYEPIGMDHFARPTDELARARAEGRLRRNFQGYTVIPARDVVGLGVSAIGDLQGGYFQNHKKLSTYREALKRGQLPIQRGQLRSADDELRRTVIHELMCNFQVDVAEVERHHDVEFSHYFADDLERLRVHERDGMVEITPELIQATPRGELFVRNLAMCFDRYMRDRHESSTSPSFSRTV